MADIIFRAARSKVVQIVLYSVIVISFAFVGIEAYVRTPPGQDTVAEVGSQRVSTQEFDQALRNQQERFRSMLGANYDARMFDNAQTRSSLVDDLVNQKLIVVAAEKSGTTVTDVALAERIAAEQVFQEDGKFSPKRYEQVLKSNNLSPRNYEQQTRRDLERQLFVDSVTRSAFTSSVSAEMLAKALEQSREVSLVTLAPDQFTSKVKVDAAAAKTYYDQNKAEFTLPEQVRAEYIELSVDVLAQAETVKPEEIKDYYDKNLAVKYQEKAAARKKAEEVLAQVKKDPKRFADLAKQFSQDPGSGQNGGSLGYFGRGQMVKPFEDAVFNKLKENQISDLVESDFGFHIIKLTGIKPKTKDTAEQREASHILINAPKEGKDFETAKAEIERTLKRERATKRFADVAQTFTERVFEQSATAKPALQPVAEELKLTVRTTPWMTKGAALPPFNNPKLSNALFSDDVIKNKRNTDAVEVAPNTLIAARVAELKPAEVRPLATVEQQLIARLTRQEAGKLAKADGEAKLKTLKEGKDAGVTWPAPLAVSRQNTGALPPNVLEQVLKAPTATLPGYIGVSDPQGGYTLVKLTKVIDAPKPDEAKLASFRQRAEQSYSQEELLSMLGAMKKRVGVKVRKDKVEKQAEN
jgi:peptidyl-prolyl cis-trans isomerase D